MLPSQYCLHVEPSAKMIVSLQLTLTAKDNGQYPKNADNQCVVTITVERNNFPPIFQNVPYDFAIDRTALSGSVVSDSITAIDNDAPVRQRDCGE